MLADEKVVDLSKKFVTLILRRPHAYKFAADHKGASIPGIAILDAEGKLAGNFAFGKESDTKDLAEALEAQLK